MKKLLLFSIQLLFFVEYSSAQITITTADMPVVNDTIRYNTTNNIQGLDPTLTGANYTWDYSTLTSTTQRIDTFFSVTSTPFAYQFYFNNAILYAAYKASYALRGTDLVMPPTLPIPISITDVFNFKKNSSSKYENVGFGSKINGIPSSTRNTPIDVEYEFPMNYLDSHHSNSAFIVSIPSIAAYGQSMDRNTIVEGWGKLITPIDTFDVLKVKSVLTKIDTLFLDTLGFGMNFPRPEEIEYKWLANGMGVPVLKIITTAGVVSSIEYQNRTALVGIKEYEALNGFNIYPNPTTKNVTLTFNSLSGGNVSYAIKDVTGKTILTKMVNAVSGKNNFTIDFAQQHLSNGIYLVEIQMNDLVLTRKMIFSE